MQLKVLPACTALVITVFTAFPSAADDPYIISYPDFIKKNNLVNDFSADHTRIPWSKIDYPSVVQWLKVNKSPIGIIEEASKRQHYYRPYVADPEMAKFNLPPSLMTAGFPSLAQNRAICDLLLTRAMLNTGENNTAAAWADILTVMRLCRLFAQAPTTIDFLAVIAVNNLAGEAAITFVQLAKLSKEQLKKCLDDLEKLPPLPSLSSKYDLGERCYLLDTFLLARRQPAESPEASKALSKINWDLPLKKINANWDRLVAALSEPDRQKRLQLLMEIEAKNGVIKRASGQPLDAKVIDQQSLDNQADTLFAFLLPAVLKVNNAVEIQQQRQRNVFVALALELYRADHGSYPDSLAKLSPTYLKAAPADLFSRQLLLYSKSDMGYRFYSVGPNGKDDGGRTTTDDPAGDDLVVKLYWE
ncbi:MAG: hypothetical protein JNJ77_00370 [Planctomycetia bacterium]|nr:hypothetical protein [Planctomycetia bacterium]